MSKRRERIYVSDDVARMLLMYGKISHYLTQQMSADYEVAIIVSDVREYLDEDLLCAYPDIEQRMCEAHAEGKLATNRSEMPMMRDLRITLEQHIIQFCGVDTMVLNENGRLIADIDKNEKITIW